MRLRLVETYSAGLLCLHLSNGGTPSLLDRNDRGAILIRPTWHDMDVQMRYVLADAIVDGDEGTVDF